MTIGEMIALLCIHCSDEVSFLMSREINGIEVNDDYIDVLSTDGWVRIERKEEWIE